MELRIYVRNAASLSPLVEFLESNDARVTYSEIKSTRGFAGVAVAHSVNIELWGAIAAMDGVGLIEEIKPLLNPFAGLRVDVVIVMETEESAQTLVEFLDSVGDEVESYKRRTDESGRTEVTIRGLMAGYMLHIEEMDGYLMRRGVEESSRSVDPSPALRQSVPELTGADQWHRAGFTGAGVKVALFDGNLLGIERLAILRGAPVKFHCYDSDGTVVAGQVPVPTPDPSAPPDATPAPSFDACTSNAPLAALPHGMLVAEALFEVAPDVDLHVSNANTPSQVFGTLDWLRESGVKVVSHSAGDEWDGPGDGTSPFNNEERRSILNIANDVVAAGAVWSNASGNSAEGTWFRRDLDFQEDGFLNFEPPTSAAVNDCNAVTVSAGEGTIIQLRWSGSWGGSDIELVLHLVRPVHGGEDELVAISTHPQLGEDDHYPYESIELMPDQLSPGSYCLKVSKLLTDGDPDWVQLQVFKPQKVRVSYRTSSGSVINPAESNNRGVMSVGASRGSSLGSSASYSSRGPVPEPHPRGRVEPDLLSIGAVEYSP